MRIVVALGGNALLRRGEALTAENQRRNMRQVAPALARIAADHTLIVVHGNGPQVGLLALEGEAYADAPPMPLDMLGAESQGMIGYVIQQELRRTTPTLSCVTVLTQTVVAANDPAFANPTKPIGPVYDAAEAKRLAEERGWQVAPDGDGFRRVVGSPIPQRIVELEAVRQLVAAGTVPICAGGGGVPVIEGNTGLAGVEAVVDKDLAASLLAMLLGADRLIILTDVAGVFADWGTPEQRLLRQIDAETCDPTQFAAGSMAPKLSAACGFARATGKAATIAALSALDEAIAGTAGTTILSESLADSSIGWARSSGFGQRN
ncbi:MAG: carbamate kinase [Methyloligella sp. ZOD6]